MTREITIRPALNGYICQVGCQTVVFQTRALLLVELAEYLEKPELTEQRYLNAALNKPHLPEMEAPTPSELTVRDVARELRR